MTSSELVLYRTEDGRTRIQCRFEENALWLTQAQLAELFQTSVPNINQHLTAIFEEVELAPEATIKSHLIVRQEGGRQVTRKVMHYSLPAILAVGVREGRQTTQEAGSEAHVEAGEKMTTPVGIEQQIAGTQQHEHHTKAPC